MGFDAHDVAKQIQVEVKRLHSIVRLHDAGLAKQLKEACQSIVLNLGEGARRSGGDRMHHFRIADGSARETLDALDVAEAWDYLSPDDTRTARELLDRELAMCWRLTHAR
jgi:four helix bundle protein